jgi:ribonuclease P protein component
VLRAVPNALSYSRFGFVISRRVSTHAVDRNKIRRRLREIVRLGSVKPGFDVLFIARRNAVTADYWALKRATDELKRRAGLTGEVEGTEGGK